MGGIDWIVLAEDMEKWWALVNAVLTLWVSASTRNFFTN